MRFGVKISHAAGIALAGLAFTLAGCSGPDCGSGNTQSFGKEWEESPLKEIPMPTFGEYKDFTSGPFESWGDETMDGWTIEFKNVEAKDAEKYVESLDNNECIKKKYPGYSSGSITESCANSYECSIFWDNGGRKTEQLSVAYEGEDSVGDEKVLRISISREQ